MDQGRVSVSYARAILHWANSNKLASDVYAQSKRLIELIAENPEFSQLLKSPGVLPSKKLKIISTLLVEYAPNLIPFLSLVIKNKREKELIRILQVFQKLYREQYGFLKVHLVSTTKLEDNTIKAIDNYLAKSFNKTIEIDESVNPEIIGGFILTIEDQMLDKSVRGDLEKFRRQLLGK